VMLLLTQLEQNAIDNVDDTILRHQCLFHNLISVDGNGRNR
jgi:hypothetical protein